MKAARLPAASALALLALTAAAAEQVLVLRDGGRIAVTRLVRRDRLVLFETTRGEHFSVSEDQVASPPLQSIPRLDGPPPVSPPWPAPRPPPSAPPPAALPPLPSVKEGPRRPDRQGRLKGGKPIAGDDVFLVLTGVLDAPVEVRRLPVGSGVSTADSESPEFFGRGGQLFATPRAVVSAELYGGKAASPAKRWAVKASGAFNLNYLETEENSLVHVDVRQGKRRRRRDAALEEAFGELKLLDLAPRLGSLSLRAGIQPFLSDFRGFVFGDTNLGLRLFGSAANDRVRYNVAAFDLLEKDTNSELNTFEKRGHKVMVANAFVSDAFRRGHTLSVSLHRSEDRASKEQHYDRNGFLVRPAKVGTPRLHNLTVNYAGVSGDGRFGPLDVSHAAYLAFGDDQDNPIAARPQDIQAGLVALELTLDRDRARFRLAGMFASGDNDMEDGRATGFDSIYDLTSFAGGPFSFWSRSGIALVPTGVLLKGPGSLLPALRSNKFEGQANFVNPGLLVVNASADLQLTPRLKAVLNASHLWFHQTDALELLLFQPSIDHSIGFDLGAGLVYRPLRDENVVLTTGVTGLVPAIGFEDIYSSVCGAPGCGAEKKRLASVFLQLRLTY